MENLNKFFVCDSFGIFDESGVHDVANEIVFVNFYKANFVQKDLKFA